MSVALAKVESWEDHVEAWHHLGRRMDDDMWSRAAIAKSVKGRWGEVRKFAAAVGFDRSTVQDYANTFEAFPEVPLRNGSLTFYHHLLARRHGGSADKAREAIEQAALKGWSVRDVTAYLKPSAEETTTTDGDSCSTDGGSCGAPTNRDKQFHIAGLVESLMKSMNLFEAVKGYDLDPLIEHGTKKSLRELSKKADAVIEWLQSLKSTIRRRTQ